MQEKFKNLPLRIGVGIILLNKDNKVFVAKRLDNPHNYWQMPQGGVDGNEKFLDAALRELEEETGVKNVDLIQEIEGYQTYFLPKNLLGIIWRGKYKGQKQKWFAREGDIINGKALIVLINKGSASASEIVAGALKDHKRAVLVGEKSYGKGSVQSIIPLKNRGAIRLTISKYYLPSGKSISEVGVTPDITVEEESDDFRILSENDNQLKFARKLFTG